jgi:hypothetical protein
MKWSCRPMFFVHPQFHKGRGAQQLSISWRVELAFIVSSCSQMYCLCFLHTIIFGPNGDKVTERWRKVHNKELHYLYSAQSIIRMIKSRRMRWEGQIERMEEKRNAYRLLVGKPEGKRPLGRPRRRWVHVRTDLGEVGWGDVDWTDLAHGRGRWRATVNSVLNLRVP